MAPEVYFSIHVLIKVHNNAKKKFEIKSKQCSNAPCRHPRRLPRHPVRGAGSVPHAAGRLLEEGGGSLRHPLLRAGHRRHGSHSNLHSFLPRNVIHCTPCFAYMVIVYFSDIPYGLLAWSQIYIYIYIPDIRSEAGIPLSWSHLAWSKCGPYIRNPWYMFG